MDKKEVEYLQSLLEIFKIEAQEHLAAISAGLMQLEKPNVTNAASLVENVYREAHSLKGAARAVNLGEIESLCQKLESVFAEMKRVNVAGSSRLFDALHSVVSELDTILQALHTPRSVAEKARTDELCRQLESASQHLFGSPDQSPVASSSSSAERRGQGSGVRGRSSVVGSRSMSGNPQSTIHNPQSAVPAQAAPPKGPASAEKAMRPSRHGADESSRPIDSGHPAHGASETIRVSTAKLDALLLQAEELISARLTAGYRAAELRKLAVTMAAWTKEWSKVRSSVRSMQQNNAASPVPMGGLIEFLDWNESFVKSLEGNLGALSKAADHDQNTLAGMTDTLLEDVKKVLMLPFASLLEMFPKMAREISRSRGKEVDLIIRGGEVEIDRRILEAIKDPLIHLVRNSIDHGIEEAQERIRLGKPERGTLRITVAQRDANKIEVVVSDDGAGIRSERVLATAVKSGLLAEREAGSFSEADALALIFQSGFSTSPMITDLSGRGLGLAIVREKVEKLGGTVTVESQPRVGTTFRLVLPLTIATCRAILVQAGTQLFVLPTTHVERVLRVEVKSIKQVGSKETIMVDGEPVSLARLTDTLGLPDHRPPTTDHRRQNSQSAIGEVSPAILLQTGEKKVAFLVDEVLDEQEVLVKGLGPQLVRVRNIAGATVLGNGKVAPILNIVDLLKSSLQVRGQSGARASARTTSPEDKPVAKRQSILIVEDSMTSRTLFKNILEGAGYSVKTAVDGLDALSELRMAEYDLLLSDIEMPRLNGLDLTAKVRADQKLADLPVVLVTSLESREDRERGAEVGANAYLVKRGFDQGNLLETIRRLI